MTGGWIISQQGRAGKTTLAQAVALSQVGLHTAALPSSQIGAAFQVIAALTVVAWPVLLGRCVVFSRDRRGRDIVGM